MKLVTEFRFRYSQRKNKNKDWSEQSVRLIRGKNRDANSCLIVGQQTFKDSGCVGRRGVQRREAAE